MRTLFGLNMYMQQIEKIA